MKTPETCNFTKKEALFSCEFSEICRNTFFTKHLWATASFVHFTLKIHFISFHAPPLFQS